ncbi:MAG: hypothetical protein KF687_16695 [Cyclobacteriaceae bacterium]|nr:hypothetical protein [Cyclobacteriaceae bacterium]
MSVIKFILLLLLLSCSQLLVGQNRPQVTLLEILEKAITGESNVVSYTDYDILVHENETEARKSKPLTTESWLVDAIKAKGLGRFNEDGKLIIPSSLRLDNCVFKNTGEGGFDEITNIHFEKSVILLRLTADKNGYAIHLKNVTFDSYFIFKNYINLEIEKCEFKSFTIIRLYQDDAKLELYESKFFSFPKYSFDPASADTVPSREYQLQVTDTLAFEAVEISLKNGEYFSFTDNELQLREPLHRGVSVYGNIANLDVSNNRFNGWLKLECFIEKRFELTGNNFFSNLDITNCSLPELSSNSKIDWSTIDSRQLCNIVHFKTENEVGLYWPRLGELFLNSPIAAYDGSYYNSSIKDFHYNLIGSYRRLYNIFKELGYDEFSNACYITLKDLETVRYQGNYSEYGGFKNWTRWRLNQLLKQYTVYGTDPADAIVGSVYIILLFGLFYFFFPSEWDIKSKKMLLQDFRIFIRKNEHGYIKPFFKLITGFFISLINALTLSLNAFVTLGFGNIPASGLARYVCVVQGLIGWFLLSIFTVALINQILY